MPQYLGLHTFTSVSDENDNVGSVAGRTFSLEEMAHELRQPLSVIESLAYYLQMTSRDEVSADHLRRIQAMVIQANRVLRKACGDC